MILGTPVIKLCSECSDPIEEQTLLSGSTLDATFWTDGKMEAPMLPDRHLFYKCPHCNSLLWADKLEKFILPSIESMDFDNDSDYDLLDKARDIRDKIKPYIVPNMYEYLYELSNIDNLDTESIKYLRVQAWWSSNDVRRASDIKKPLSRQEKDNLIELYDLLDTVLNESDNNVNNKIFQAEINRELSLFSASSQILNSIADDQSDIVYTIKNLNKQQNPYICELEKYSDKLIIEHHDNGGIAGKGLIFKEKKQGVWTYYFHNGQKHSKGEFINGQVVGEWIFWHPNGVKYRQGVYSQVRSLYGSIYPSGGPDNNTNSYALDGLKDENQYSNEVLIGEDAIGGNPSKKGLWKQWYDSGSIEFEGYYNDNSLPDGVEDYEWGGFLDPDISALCYKSGLWKTYYKNKQLKKEVSYRFDKSFLIMSDNIVSNESIVDFSEEFGVFNEWYENGHPKSKGVMDNGRKIGEWKYWYDNKQLALSCEYCNEDSELGITGAYTEWYRNGQKKLEHTFGNYTRYSALGKQDAFCHGINIDPYLNDEFKADIEWNQEGEECHNKAEKYYEQPYTKTCYEGTPFGCLMVVNTENINTLHATVCSSSSCCDDLDCYTNFSVSPMEYISTSATARELNINPNDLFYMLLEDGFLEKNNSNKYVVTNKGYGELGGLYRNKKQDKYVLTEKPSNENWPVWPAILIHDYVNNRNVD